MIDLRSDTVTKPSRGMLMAMTEAEVGDDVFKEDPTANALEKKLAALFKMEAALFFPSGTMANQVAIKLHTTALDELISTADAHVYQYEGGGYAFHSQIAINPIHTEDGILRAEAIIPAIKPSEDWLPSTRLVSIENSSNRTGGNIYPLTQMQDIYAVCKRHNLRLHIDGARIFNAIIAGGYTAEDVGKNCDSISICLSKGLGAPVGSVLLSTTENIVQARKLRKVFGGGMRQIGFLAAAGIYALDNNVERLVDDHLHAEIIKEALTPLTFVKSIKEGGTNIVIFDLVSSVSTDEFLHDLENQGVRASKFGPQTVRMVTHLDVSVKEIEEVIKILQALPY